MKKKKLNTEFNKNKNKLIRVRVKSHNFVQNHRINLIHLARRALIIIMYFN